MIDLKDLNNKDIFIYLYFNDEFKKINIDLHVEQLEKLAKQLLENKTSIELDLKDEQLINTKYTKEDDVANDFLAMLSNIKNLIDKEEISKYFSEESMIALANKYAENEFRILVENTPKYHNKYQKEKIAVIKNIDDIWGFALDLFELQINTAIKITTEFDVAKLNIYKDNIDLYDSLQRLQSRACLVSNEILVLLRNGFADGGYARYRTLYEIMVLNWFISSKGNKAAKRYLDSSIVKDNKDAKELNKYAEMLGECYVSDDNLEDLKKSVENLKKEYGNNFVNGDYGWSSPFITAEETKKIYFSDLENSIDLRHLKPHYRFASNNIHCGASSLYSHISLPDDLADKLLFGASYYGIDKPLYLSSRTLNMISINYLLCNTENINQIINVEILKKINIKIEELLEDIANSYTLGT